MTNFIKLYTCVYSQTHTDTQFVIDSLSQGFANLISKQILKALPLGIVREIYVKQMTPKVYRIYYRGVK